MRAATVEDPKRLVPNRFTLSARAWNGFAIAGILTALFLYCAWPAFSVQFESDDIMNLNFAWQPPLGSLLLANLVPFTSFYRPTGADYYRLCFAVFGWNPAAFRLVTCLFLLLNVYLVYLLGRRLSGSGEMAVVAALIYTFNSRFREIYLRNGTVYDVLCCTFVLLTFCYYIRLRQTGERWTWRNGLTLYALFTAALNAKEMAAIIPAMLALYEWLYHGPVSLRPRALAHWMWRHATAPAIGAALVGLAAWAKSGPASLMHGNPIYIPSFTVSRFLENERHQISDLVHYHSRELNVWQMAAIYLMLFAVAYMAKKNYLWWLAWFAVLAPLPMILIPYRNFFAMYVPYAGWAMYLGCVAVLVRDRLLRIVGKRPAPGVNLWAPGRVALFTTVALVVVGGRHDRLAQLVINDPSQQIIARTYGDFRRLNEPIPKAAKVLILRSAFPADSWGPVQVMRMTYRDRDLAVDLPSKMAAPPDAQAIGGYDRVFDFDGERLFVAARGRSVPGGSAPRTLVYPR